MLFLYSDKKLLADLRSSDLELNNRAFRFFYDRYYSFAEKITRAVFNNTVEAPDIFQESLIAVYENVRNQSFRGESSFKTYLYSIIRNKVYLRKLKKTIIQKTEKKYWRLTADNFDITNEIDTNHIEIKEYIAHSFLEKLSQRCRDILRLYYFEKMSMQNISTTLNFSNVESARAQKYRCMQKLTSYIEKTPATKNSIIEVI